ncbi:hypothetical protein KSD_33600 [Ktedonobacter sp. SOSP1-85]|nr:hypothetical protein KSD_33600 [Ktedonobacter sp. SOSP1-85]
MNPNGSKKMPRQQPPKGYLTSTQVKERLNVSGAMIANYVQQGKIKRIVSPGRKHGFYLERDVDKIVNELQTFFNNISEETTNADLENHKNRVD